MCLDLLASLVCQVSQADLFGFPFFRKSLYLKVRLVLRFKQRSPLSTKFAFTSELQLQPPAGGGGDVRVCTRQYAQNGFLQYMWQHQDPIDCYQRYNDMLN